MRTEVRDTATHRILLGITGRVLATLGSVIAVAALVVRLTPGAAPATRDLLALRLSAAPGDPSQVLDLLGANARVVALPLLGALVARSLFGRVTFDALVAAVIAQNATLLGAALGAYGQRLLPWLPHAPLELLAIAQATAIYLAARSMPLTAASIVRALQLVAAALVAAALLETYLAPL